MRHGVKRVHFNRNMGERKALMRSLLVALFTHEKIVTTEAKAKALKPVADHLIHKAKTKDLATKRLLLSDLPHPVVVQKLLDELGPRFSNRTGGYSRIVKLGRRMSDASPMARIELLDSVIELAVNEKPKKLKDKGPVEREVDQEAEVKATEVALKKTTKKSETTKAQQNPVAKRQTSTRRQGTK